jgi:putative flippase GtrA
MERLISEASKHIHVFFMKILFALHIRLKDEQQQSLVQFIRFGLVGLSNTILGYLLYLFVLLILKHLPMLDSMDYLLSNVVSWILCVFWSFIWNRRCVFDAQFDTGVTFFSTLFKAYCSYALTGLLLNNLLLYIEVEKLHIPKEVAPFFVLIISIPVNFLLNKFWTFRRRTQNPEKR